MLGTDFYVFLVAMVLAIGLLFLMVWHVSFWKTAVNIPRAFVAPPAVDYAG